MSNARNCCGCKGGPAPGFLKLFLRLVYSFFFPLKLAGPSIDSDKYYVYSFSGSMAQLFLVCLSLSFVCVFG